MKTAMKLQIDSKIRINCPSERKYPAFYAAFHGKSGVVQRLPNFGEVAVVLLDKAKEQITVEPEWLAHQR